MWSIHSQWIAKIGDVWNSYFAPLNAVNIGIGGDKVEQILWRVEDLELPSSLAYLFLHCGANNISRIISRRHCRWDPFDRNHSKKETGTFEDYSWWPSSLRYFTDTTNIDQVNTILWQKINKLDGLYFMEQDCVVILLQMTHCLYYKIIGKVQKLLKTLSNTKNFVPRRRFPDSKKYFKVA